jgi:hypothetical protein
MSLVDIDLDYPTPLSEIPVAGVFTAVGPSIYPQPLFCRRDPDSAWSPPFP